jgi:fluoroquinolone transport system permease protein
VGYRLIGVTPLPSIPLVAISIVGALSAPLLALVLATAAPNKVAGFAIVKVLNGLNLLPVAAFFVPRPLQYVAGIIPAYWPMRAFWSAADREDYLAYLVIGVMTAGLALVLAASMFERKLGRRG